MLKKYSPQKAENAVISQRNHPVDIHIFHNAHATVAWPQQTLLQETLELERTTYMLSKVNCTVMWKVVVVQGSVNAQCGEIFRSEVKCFGAVYMPCDVKIPW